MDKKLRIRIIVALAFFVIYLIIWTILHFVFKELDFVYKGMITALLTVFLSPRIKNYQTQTGNKVQVKWIFMKKPLFE